MLSGLLLAPLGALPAAVAEVQRAQPDVLLTNRRAWEDRAALALRPDVAAGLGVRYTVQRALVNGWLTPQTSPSPWQVTQVFPCLELTIR